MRAFTALLILSSFAIAQPSTKPTRVQHMLYDTQRKQLALLTISSESKLEELWTWTGNEWTLNATPGTPARESGGAVYDTRRNRFVLFGGIGTKNENDRLGDLWESDGNRWGQLNSTDGETRDHHHMAFDEDRGRVVVYGGQSMDRTWLTDTSEWDGTKWTKISSTGPGSRVHSAMVYDSRRKLVVLFGGFDQQYKAHNDLWGWNGKEWQKLSEEGPPPRSHHAMAFDVDSGSLVLFGGLKAARSTAALNDTWIWNGKQWTEVKTASGPAPRSNHVMAYDRGRHKIVLYGGGSFDGQNRKSYQDTWEWDGKRWQLVNS